MKVALVAPLISPLKEPHIGGAQVFLCALAQELQNRGHTVTMYAAEGSDLANIKVHSYPLSSRDLHIQIKNNEEIYFEENISYQEQAQTFKKIYQDISKEGYDIVHNHALDPPSFEEIGRASCRERV